MGAPVSVPPPSQAEPISVYAFIKSEAYGRDKHRNGGMEKPERPGSNNN
jgi:hypothetical protein